MAIPDIRDWMTCLGNRITVFYTIVVKARLIGMHIMFPQIMNMIIP